MSDSYGAMPPPPGPGAGYGYGYPAPQRGERPPGVENAVRLMFAVAALSLVSTIVAFATKSDLKARIDKANPDMSASQINTLLNTAFAVGLVIGVVFLVLYILLAFRVRAGKNWARICHLSLRRPRCAGGRCRHSPRPRRRCPGSSA